MAWSDVLPTIEKLAPMIATGLGTPLLGGAVAALEGVFGLTPDPASTMDDRQTAVATAMQNATPDQLLAITKANNDYALAMANAGFKNQTDLASIALQRDQAAAADVADARKNNSGNPSVFRLAYVTIGVFAILMASVLYGIYGLLTGGIQVKDAGIVAAVAGLVGSIVGYVAANTQTVYNFIFGGSLGGNQHTDTMTTAISNTIAEVASKK
jgi:hypothetical protein